MKCGWKVGIQNLMKIAIDKNNVVYSIPDKHIENEVNEYINRSINSLNNKGTVVASYL